jgi:hypothetical protein
MSRCLAILLLVSGSSAFAEPATPLGALAKMPVQEVTVFKDGHAYVMHQGTMPVDASGNVVLDLLPNPVLGTFWPYSLDKNAKLHSVTASRRNVKVERTSLTVRELLEANPGAEVSLTEGNKPPYSATIVKLLSQSTEELEALNPAGSEVTTRKGTVLLLKTLDGTRCVPIDSITDVKFLGQFETKISSEEYRNLLSLKLDWGGQPAAKTADVGMAYVQKGIRWIPNYRIDLDANGKAVVKLQATILNELIDLKNATVNLVIGVPSFEFKETTDPIALNSTLAQLSPYFVSADSQFSNAIASNRVMTQQMGRMGEMRPPGAAPAAPDLGPNVGENVNEDLFVFTLKNVTLAKGQRMVLPITQQTVDYKDVYTLDVSYAPPVDVRRQPNDPRAAELQKLLAAPKVMHKIRLTNGNSQPFTTAPALLMKDGKVLSQGMMMYTAKGATVDLTLTTAVNVRVKKTDVESKRTPNAQNFDGHPFWRVDIASKLELMNYGTKPIEVEVTRHVLGNLDKASDGVKAEMLNLIEDDDSPTAARPTWWGYYSWPSWWSHFNGIGRLTWTAKLEPGKSNEQSYTWHYFWR